MTAGVATAGVATAEMASAAIVSATAEGMALFGRLEGTSTAAPS